MQPETKSNIPDATEAAELDALMKDELGDDAVVETVVVEEVKAEEKQKDEVAPVDKADEHIGKDGKPLPNMVPRSRVAEEAEKRREVEGRLSDAELRLATLQKQIEDSKTAETTVTSEKLETDRVAAVQAYDDCELDFASYNKEITRINREEARLIAREIIAEERAAEHAVLADIVAKDINKSFALVQKDWRENNAEFLAIDGAAAAMQEQIQLIDRNTGNALHDAELIRRAEKAVFAIFDYEQKVTDAKPDDKKTLEDKKPTERQVNAAKNAAAASSLPAASPGSTGNRATTDGVDVSEAMSTKQWAGMSQEQQNRALGIAE